MVQEASVQLEEGCRGLTRHRVASRETRRKSRWWSSRADAIPPPEAAPPHRGVLAGLETGAVSDNVDDDDDEDG